MKELYNKACITESEQYNPLDAIRVRWTRPPEEERAAYVMLEYREYSVLEHLGIPYTEYLHCTPAERRLIIDGLTPAYEAKIAKMKELEDLAKEAEGTHE